MRHLLRLFVFLLLLQPTPVSAGVVEDAEEELKKLRGEQGQEQRAPDFTPPPYPVRSSPSFVRPRGSSSARPTGAANSSTKTPDSQVRASKGQNFEEEVEEFARPPRVITQEDKKGYFFSFLIILIFAVLIALASLFGRRVETEE